jgi:predicted nucleic acid-binding protein
MILVDSSIWIDYINKGEPALDRLLIDLEVYMHPHVLGEVALGSIRRREQLLPRLLDLPCPRVVEDGYVLDLIDRETLWSTGLSFTDAHLLASALQTFDTLIWTRDKALRAQAERLSVVSTLI